MSLAPGTKAGPFEVVEQLGAGGMGEVYRATDANLKRSVAIKVLPTSTAADPDRLARFQREAEVLGALNHPNIAAIYGLVDLPAEAGSRRALIMELVEGEDLSALIARGAIPLTDALPIARQIADALDAAHDQGIIHRDLKPANIKVRPDGTVKVLDFGLAKTLDPRGGPPESQANSPTLTSPAMTARGVILGTAAYMSPEQASGRAVDKRADIWAFGVVLYEMLSGTSPFARASGTETMAAVIRDAPDMHALGADIPPGVRRLIERCLVKDTRARLRDIGDARLELTAEAGSGDRVERRRTRVTVLSALPWLLALGLAVALMAWPRRFDTAPQVPAFAASPSTFRGTRFATGPNSRSSSRPLGTRSRITAGGTTRTRRRCTCAG